MIRRFQLVPRRAAWLPALVVSGVITATAFAQRFEGTYLVTTRTEGVDAAIACGFSSVPPPGEGPFTLDWTCLDCFKSTGTLGSGSGTLSWEDETGSHIIVLSGEESSPGFYLGEWPGTTPPPNSGSTFGRFSLTIGADTARPEPFGAFILLDWSCFDSEGIVAGGQATFLSDSDDDDDDCPKIGWTNPAGGAFDDPGNWNGDLVPADEDTALFNLDLGGSVVAFAGDVTNDALQVTENANLNLGGFTYTLTGDCRSESINVGGAAAPDLDIANGTVNAADRMIIGKGPGDEGSITVADGGTLICDELSDIGEGGKGTLSVFGSFEGSRDVTVGRNAGSVGAVVADGANALFEIKELGDLVIGSAGLGTFTVKSGGSVDVRDNTQISRKAGSAGSKLTITGQDSLWINQGELTIGEQANSDGRLSVLASAGALLIGPVIIGELANSKGEIQVAGGAALTAGITVVGQAGTGTLTIQSDARVTGSAVTSIAAKQFSKGTVTVEGLGTDWDTQDTLNVGFAGQGFLKIKDQATVTSKDAILGNVASGRGDVTLEDGASWIVAGAVQVGLSGSGILSVDADCLLQANLVGVSSTGTIDTTTIFIGTSSGGSNAKRRLTAQPAEPSTGIVVQTLEIEDGATLNVEQIILAEGGTLRGDGALDVPIVNQGKLDVGGENGETGELTVNGDLTLEAGSEVQVDIGGLIPGEEYDVLIVNGHCQLGGRLKINLVNGYTPNVGDRFEVLKYESREGEYDTIDSDGTGVHFTPELANGRLTLVAAVVDESGRLSPEELADLARLQDACGPGCGPMGLMPLALTLVGLCTIKRSRGVRVR